MQQLPSHINKIIFMLIVSIPFSVFAGKNISLELYKEKKHEEAFQYFNELAEVGNTRAMYYLGLMYYKGEGVRRDLVKAYAWMSVASERQPNEEIKKSIEELFNSLFESEQKAAKELAVVLKSRFSETEVKVSLAPRPLSDKDCTKEVIPIKRSPPEYPQSEIFNGHMGIVEFEYSISPQGYIRDVIVTSSRSDAFTKSVNRVLPSWRYSPRILNNRAVTKDGVRMEISFMIESNRSELLTNRKVLLTNLNDAKEKAMKGDISEQYKYAVMLNQYRKFQNYLGNINLEYQEANKWYLASALSGLANSQYYLGRNISEGFGCEIDEKSGTKWIRTAAIGGYSPAQHYIAAKMIGDPNEKNYREAIKFLNYSIEQDDYYPSKILLAWEYATSLLDDVRNGQGALDLLKSEAKDYYDPVRIKETQAAAYAETGDFANAVNFQNNALQEAKKYGWEIAEMRSRLKSYQDHKPWRGEYYVSISPPPKIETPDLPDNLKQK